jgi:catechol 2,3-dioxygenase-like lactoylglutathione lyase family enzyme
VQRLVRTLSIVGLLVAADRPVAAEEAKESAPPPIDHILLEVKDLNRSIAFYRDQLGLTLKKRSGDFATLESANVGVYLWSKRWDWSSPPPKEGRTPQGMYPHFVIPDVKGTMARLRKAGYHIVAEAKDYDYGTEGFVADPDGFVWALISR